MLVLYLYAVFSAPAISVPMREREKSRQMLKQPKTFAERTQDCRPLFYPCPKFRLPAVALQ